MRTTRLVAWGNFSASLEFGLLLVRNVLGEEPALEVGLALMVSESNVKGVLGIHIACIARRRVGAF